MIRVLALKPSCTRSQTKVAIKDKDGPEATANLAPVEPVTEAVSHQVRDPSSTEYIKLISFKGLPLGQENFKKMTKVKKKWGVLKKSQEI